MIKEHKYFNCYTVLQIKRNNNYEYYLEKDGYGNLFYMYGTAEECFPKEENVCEYVKEAEEINFWKE